MNPTRALTPDGGAYQNEADVFEPDYKQSFYGRNYNRLAKIKKQIDPRNALQVWQGVGFEPESPLWKCYGKL